MLRQLSITLLPRSVRASVALMSVLFLSLLLASNSAAVLGAWSPTGDLVTARAGQTATVLPGNKVLVAGGFDLTGFFTSAEIYDLATGTWTAAPSMSDRRVGHAATQLADGRVLVVGGSNNPATGAALASAEIFDPVAGSWTTTGSLATARVNHTATLLTDGRVLVAGGADPLSTFASAEIFDPVAGSWTATGSLTTARMRHKATRLADGRVLVAGGEDEIAVPPVVFASAEVFDPVAGSWTATGSMAAARVGHAALLLAGGKVLVAGGENLAATLATAELFDPAVGAWAATGAMANARTSYAAAMLADNRTVLVAGGFGNNTVLFSAEVYDSVAGTWSSTGRLADARARFTATLLGTKVVATGGNRGGGFPFPTTELYDGPPPPP